MERELDLLLHEIFDSQPYTRHGVVLSDGMCVVDLGANLGLFSLWCTLQARELRIVACEPIPPLAELARRNLAGASASRVTLLACGLGDSQATREVSYYPRATACSTLYAAATEEQMPELYSGTEIRLADLWSIHKGAFLLGLAVWPIYPWVRRQLVRRVLSKALSERQDHPCPFTTLSALIDEHELDRIDLLKIDVQGSESQILAGIRDEHWDRIGSIAMEVNRFLGPQPSPDLFRLLTERGFRTTREDDPAIAAPGSHFLYATRPRPMTAHTRRGPE